IGDARALSARRRSTVRLTKSVRFDSGGHTGAMRIIGLVGGIASGKTTVAELLRERGAIVLDADRAGHQVLNELEVRHALVQRWGDSILDERGRVNRAAVAERVFGSSPDAAAERQFLEEVVHPRIRLRLEAEVAGLPHTAAPAVVIDAPLLFEAGWDTICRHTLLVDCRRECRAARAAQRGWSDAELARREAVQMPIVEKRRRASHVIRNDGSLDELRRHVDDFWKSVVRY
ncbi:MAG: dephospho-CoA kinase, partial [Planctomycetota bacterium]